MSKQLTLDQFMEAYLFPFDVRGTNLDDVECMHTFYRSHILQCDSIKEMRQLCAEFKFLTRDALVVLNTIQDTPTTTRRIKRLFQTKTSAIQLAPIIVPHVILWGKLIADKYGLPEYPAAVQYVAAHLRKQEMKDDKKQS